MDYLDYMEEEYHKSYPNNPCPMEGGYKASFERFEIESLRAELDNQRDYHLRSVRSKICVICEICGKKKSSEDYLRHQRNLRAIMTRSKNSPKNLVVSPKTLIFAGVIEIKIKNYGKDH